MPFSLPLACKLSASPQAIQNPKYVPLPKPTTRLTTKTPTQFLSSPQCKPLYLSSNTKTSFVRHAADGEATLEDPQQLSEEQYNKEREIIVQNIEVLDMKVQELLSQETDATVLEGILKDSLTIGHQVTELESKNPNPSEPHSTTQLFDTIFKQFQGTLPLKNGLVPVDPNPNLGPTSKWIDRMVKVTAAEYYDEIDPIQLDNITGNYAPVRKETPIRDAFVVEGQLPSAINGMFFRVGPDPKYDPEANYQWMDGDGMVHAVQIQDGQAKYTSHYVKNSRFQQEREFGKATMFKYGDLRGTYGVFVGFIQSLRARLEVLDMSFGYTTSNVGLIYHAGKVMALEDFGKPYVISIGEDGNMETAGMNNFNGKLNHNFTPHPKKDLVTGEMFVIALSHVAPYAHYTVVNKEGVITSDVPLTVSGPTYMHDFSITENYAVIMDNPYVFNTKNMVAKDKWVFHFDGTQKSRYGILPRNASDESDIKWFEFETDPSFIFHTVNAWEDGDTIVMYACDMEPEYDASTDDYDICPVTCRRFSTNEEEEVFLTLPELYKFTFNLTTGKATKEKVPVVGDLKLDNPKINEIYRGRKNRYAYFNSFDENGQAFGIYKHDLQTDEGIAKIINIGEEAAFLSEHVFVPRENTTSEDDGYLLLFAHLESMGNTHLVVLDALDMSLVASVDLQARIPYGFHAIFVNQEELRTQAKTLS